MAKGLVLSLAILTSGVGALADDSARTLAFQIFTGGFDSDEMRQSIPPPPKDLRKTVVDLGSRVESPPPMAGGSDSWLDRLPSTTPTTRSGN